MNEITTPAPGLPTLELKHYLWLFGFALDNLKEKIRDGENEVIRLSYPGWGFADKPYVPSNQGPREKRVKSHLEFLEQYRLIQEFTEGVIARLQKADAEQFARDFMAYVQREGKQ